MRDGGRIIMRGKDRLQHRTQPDAAPARIAAGYRESQQAILMGLAIIDQIVIHWRQYGR
jgi:hypothetical protein